MAVRVVTRAQVRKLIEKDAKKLGVSVRTALRRVRTGRLGNSYLWADISMLDTLIRNCPLQRKKEKATR